MCAVCVSDIKKTRLENKFLLCELDTSVYTIFCDCVTVVMREEYVKVAGEVQGVPQQQQSI